MDWNDRSKLYRVTDIEGETFFVQAESFADAESKFRKWDAGTENDVRDNCIESLCEAGYLIKELVPRE